MEETEPVCARESQRRSRQTERHQLLLSLRQMKMQQAHWRGIWLVVRVCWTEVGVPLERMITGTPHAGWGEDKGPLLQLAFVYGTGYETVNSGHRLS